MSNNVQFESDNNNFNQQPRQLGGMVGWLIKRGLASSASSANAILVGVAVVIFAIAIFVLVKF